jgi:Cu-processing system ATP-binding protein
MNTPALASVSVEVCGLAKRFGRLEVLRGVDLRFESGRVTAVVGPNAAGKSTLLKCILGLVRPDAGRVLMEGRAVEGRHDYRAAIGYMPQRAAFPENLTGREVLRMVEGLRPGPVEVDDDLLHRFQLQGELDKAVRAMSGGTRQKLNAVVAFRFRPRILILDEPTAGLDPLASGLLKEGVRAALERGATAILTSHLMNEIEELADTVVFMVDGQAHFHGSMDVLRRLTGEQRLERAVARLMRARVA